MTLKFTLQKIESVVNLIKGDFIGKVVDIAGLIKSGDFEDNLVPNLLNVAELINQVYGVVLEK